MVAEDGELFKTGISFTGIIGKLLVSGHQWEIHMAFTECSMTQPSDRLDSLNRNWVDAEHLQLFGEPCDSLQRFLRCCVKGSG